MKPFFSVVIPVYNRARTVCNAIDSVLTQSFQDFEIVVVDDGSTDDPGVRVRAIGDSRIRLIAQVNRGASAARNHGVDKARGRYVAFLDSDDTFLPHHLGAMAELLRETSGVVAYAPVQAYRGPQGYVVKPHRPIGNGETMAGYLMCARGFIQTSGLVVPTKAARDVRYREDVRFGDDTDFAIRLELAGYRFVMAAQPGVVWYDGPDPGRLSNTKLDSIEVNWLDDLRPRISRRAYLGYRGWHVAKGLFKTRPFAALGLYLAALTSGSYGPRLAMVVLAQIVLPGRIYRDGADVVVAIRTRGRAAIRSERSA
jgi:glycosyltransferase involved in cell wall biosynthesis